MSLDPYYKRAHQGKGTNLSNNLNLISLSYLLSETLYYRIIFLKALFIYDRER